MNIPLEEEKVKMEQDFSVETEAAIFQAKEKCSKIGAQTIDRKNACEDLLALEKKTRQGGDVNSTEKICLAIIHIFWEAKDLDTLREYLVICCKRRGQLRKVITSLVQECMNHLEALEKKQKFEMIETLRLVTEGKIFVEVERARLTRQLAQLKENDGELEEASKILQEVQVETYGTMDRQEKADFILEQIRLCLLTKDYIRVLIISQKVNVQTLNKEDWQELKLRYYNLMIDYYHHENDYFQICRAYEHIFETPKIKADPALSREALFNRSLYVVLAKFNIEQHDALHRVLREESLTDHPLYHSLLKAFATPELIMWEPFQSQFSDILSTHTVFNVSASEEKEAAQARQHGADLRRRVVEHNIRVIAGVYTAVQTPRLAQLLELSENETETYLCDLVAEEMIYCKINRPRKEVVFRATPSPVGVIQGWTENIDRLLTLIERTSCDIAKENMIHGL